MQANPEITQNVKQAAKIFEENSDMIRIAIRSKVNNKSIIDDIFHDLFLSLVHSPIPSDIENVEGYLRRAIRNDVLDEAARTKNYHNRNQRYAYISAYTRFHNPEDIVIRAEIMQNLFEVIGEQLLPYETEAITQKFRFDRNNRQAAEAMGINRKSFSCYLSTGLKKIRQFARENSKYQDDD